MKVMVAVPGGAFEMGSERFYPEEEPVKRVSVDSFWMDATAVTNAQFAKFVAATGHVTFAENRARRCRLPGQLDSAAKCDPRAHPK
jgi:formylglycine-generating enzyme